MENILHSCSKKSVKTILCMHNTPWPCMICDGDTMNVLHSSLHTHAKSMSNIWKKKHTVYCQYIAGCVHVGHCSTISTAYYNLASPSYPPRKCHVFHFKMLCVKKTSETPEKFSVAQSNDHRKKCLVSE